MAESVYQKIGEANGCRKLAAAFYARVDGDPFLRPLFPGSTLKCAIEEFAAFLVQFLAGPAEDSQRRWWLSLRESHARFGISAEHRKAWMSNMVRALDDVPIAEPARAELRDFFAESSAYMVNRGERPHAPQAHGELADRWTVQQKIDDAVDAIHRGDADRAITLTEDLSVNADLLAVMIHSRHPRLMEYVHRKLTRELALARVRYGRTLLHETAAAGSAETAELFLQLGADPNAKTGNGHTPLYSLGNECSVPGCGRIVRLLVAAGADVDAAGNVKRCTPLHMAARRGNVEIAEALVDCGASIEARDKNGDTPLQRALNCRKAGVARLLTERSSRATG